jgi:hypothetical protein
MPRRFTVYPTSPLHQEPVLNVVKDLEGKQGWWLTLHLLPNNTTKTDSESN